MELLHEKETFMSEPKTDEENRSNGERWNLLGQKIIFFKKTTNP